MSFPLTIKIWKYLHDTNFNLRYSSLKNADSLANYRQLTLDHAPMGTLHVTPSPYLTRRVYYLRVKDFVQILGRFRK